MMEQNGGTFVNHYLDDFVTVGKPGLEQCASNLKIMQETCNNSGTPVEDKSESPATVLPFLGIVFDTTKMELRLPEEKLKQLQEIVAQWRGKKVYRKELQSIIGSLAHACKVVKPGCTFLRRLIDLLAVAKKPYHHIRLTRDARSDIEWWHCFAAQWNGVSMLRSQTEQKPDIIITSDASGKWGCGAFWNQRWFQLEWSDCLGSAHITIKELIPIVLGAAVWGKEWRDLSVTALCDNAAVVEIINWGNSKDQDVMHLMRCLAFIQAKFCFSIRASHIKGSNNDLADALSRNNKDYFLSNYPQASPVPTPLPQELLDLADNNCKTRLDIGSLDMSVERYFQSGLAPSTQNCYDSAKRRFLLFCNRTGLSPLPLNKNVLCRYVASLADEGLSPKTIKSYLSATRHLQIAMSLPDPRMGEMARLEQVIKGAKREYAKRNPEIRVRLP